MLTVRGDRKRTDFSLIVREILELSRRGINFVNVRHLARSLSEKNNRVVIREPGGMGNRLPIRGRGKRYDFLGNRGVECICRSEDEEREFDCIIFQIPFLSDETKKAAVR